MDIRIREFRPGRYSITGDRKLLDAIEKWATSYEIEYRDRVAAEVCIAIRKYNRNVKKQLAHAVYKRIKSGKIQHLTADEKKAVIGSKYEQYLRHKGWL